MSINACVSRERARARTRAGERVLVFPCSNETNKACLFLKLRPGVDCERGEDRAGFRNKCTAQSRKTDIATCIRTDIIMHRLAMLELSSYRQPHNIERHSG